MFFFELIAAVFGQLRPQEKALRGHLAEILPERPGTKGRIFEALRESPLAGAGISFVRDRNAGRKISL